MEKRLIFLVVLFFLLKSRFPGWIYWNCACRSWCSFSVHSGLCSFHQKRALLSELKVESLCSFSIISWVINMHVLLVQPREYSFFHCFIERNNLFFEWLAEGILLRPLFKVRIAILIIIFVVVITCDFIWLTE